jgi:hypothetical protein
MPNMKKCLSALFVAVLLCGVSQASDGKSTANVFANYAAGWKKLTQVTRQLQGRMLCKLLRKGMTTQLVEQVLGKATNQVITGSGYCFVHSFCYENLSLSISFSGEENGVLRMTDVYFCPLLK